MYHTNGYRTVQNIFPEMKSGLILLKMRKPADGECVNCRDRKGMFLWVMADSVGNALLVLQK